MKKFHTFAAALIAVSTHTAAVNVLEGTEAGAFLASAGVDLDAAGLGSATQGNSTETGISTFVYIDVCNNCVIGGGNSTDVVIQPEPEPEPVNPMEEIAGYYVWKHDGVHTSGSMTLLPDGTLDQYWSHLDGSTWFINDNDQVVLQWPWDHVLTQSEGTRDWFMHSRNPPSKLEWVGPLD